MVWSPPPLTGDSGSQGLPTPPPQKDLPPVPPPPPLPPIPAAQAVPPPPPPPPPVPVFAGQELPLPPVPVAQEIPAPPPQTDLPPVPPPPPANIPGHGRPRQLSPKIALIAICVLAGVLIGAWYLTQLGQYPGRSVLTSALSEKLVSSQQITGIKIISKSLDNSGDAVMDLAATVETKEPCYLPVDRAQALSTLNLDATVFGKINAIVSGKDGQRILKLADLPKPPVDLDQIVFLKESAPAHYSYTMTWRVTLSRRVGAWTPLFSDATDAGNPPSGKIKSEYGQNAYCITAADDIDRLRKIMADAQASYAKLNDVAQKYNQNRQALAQKAREENLRLLSEGAIFQGQAVRNNNNTVPLFIEITSVNPERQSITALVRNDGGWGDGRRFQGTFSYDDDDQVLKLQIASRTEQALRNCGPFLQWEENMAFSLTFNDNVFAGNIGSWSCRFFRVPDQERRNFVARQSENQARLLDATKPGKVYSVIATLPDRGWTEEYWFFFTRQDPDSLKLEGYLQSQTNPGKRRFYGNLILNTYWADGAAIRLFSDDTDAVKRIREPSPLGYSSKITWLPVLDDGSMRCDNRHAGPPWHLEFKPLSDAETHRIQSLGNSAPGEPGRIVTTPAPADPAPAANTASAAAQTPPPPAPWSPLPQAPPAGPVSQTPSGVAVSPGMRVTQPAGANNLSLPQEYPKNPGVYILANQNWVVMPQGPAEQPTQVSNEELTLSMRTNPKGPWLSVHIMNNMTGLNIPLVTNPVVIAARGIMSPSPDDFICREKTFTLYSVSYTPNNRIIAGILFYPSQKKSGIAGEIDTRIIKKDDDLHLITTTQRLLPGYYSLRGFIFQVAEN